MNRHSFVIVTLAALTASSTFADTSNLHLHSGGLVKNSTSASERLLPPSNYQASEEAPAGHASRPYSQSTEAAVKKSSSGPGLYTDGMTRARQSAKDILRKLNENKNTSPKPSQQIRELDPQSLEIYRKNLLQERSKAVAAERQQIIAAAQKAEQDAVNQAIYVAQAESDRIREEKRAAAAESRRNSAMWSMLAAATSVGTPQGTIGSIRPAPSGGKRNELSRGY